MDAQKNKSNIIRRGRRNSKESSPQMTGKHINKPAFWKTVEDAKRKQEAIRNRVRKYGDEEDGSDYDDSPLRRIGGENSDSESDECSDDFDLSEPLALDNSNKNTTVPKKFFTPPTRSNAPTRKESFSNAIHPRRLNYRTHEGNTSSSANDHPLHSRKRDKLPALTPEQAVKLVMERNSYISDSERTEDPDPILSRKASISTSTNETAINTVASDSGHNRTPEGKRVLVLKKKKYREDTHPRTSKNRSYHQRNPQDPQRRPSRQQRNGGNHQIIQGRKEKEEKQQSSTFRVQRSPKKAEETHTSKIESTISDKSDVSPPREYLNPILRHSTGKGNEKPPQNGRKQGEEETMKKPRDSFYSDQIEGSDLFGNGQVEDDDYNDSIRTSIDKQPQESKKPFEEVEEHEKPSKRNSQRGTPPSAMDNEDMTEKEIFVFDFSENDYGSDTDSGKDDIDCWGGHEDNTQRPSNRSRTADAANVTIESMLEKQGDKDDDIDSLAGQEEDWRNMSWKTARTSKSVLSKYSKSSSVALWMKNMEEADSGSADQDGDIFFFDAIQEAGKSSSSSASVSTTDINESYDDAAGTGEYGGWRGKITNFVGYTIGAFTGSNDEGDNKRGDNDGNGTTPVVSYENRTLSGKSNSPSSGSTKAVPSRELEIIRKCQELMKSQQNLIQTRERDAARRNIEDIRLQRKEEAARARVYREVIAYREMMEGMGKGAKLAPLDRKIAAQDYDDRLAMVKTIEDQEKKMRQHERNMMEMEMGGNTNDESRRGKNCCCSCIIS